MFEYDFENFEESEDRRLGGQFEPADFEFGKKNNKEIKYLRSLIKNSK